MGLTLGATGKLMLRNGKLFTDENGMDCCCGATDCLDLCNTARTAAGLGPLPDTLTLELEAVSGACVPYTCSVALNRTTEVEWLSANNSCLGEWTFACESPLWQVAVLSAPPQPDTHKFAVSVNCTAGSGEALVDWYTFADANGYLGCGQPSDYLDTLRFRILIP